MKSNDSALDVSRWEVQKHSGLTGIKLLMECRLEILYWALIIVQSKKSSISELFP